MSLVVTDRVGEGGTHSPVVELGCSSRPPTTGLRFQVSQSRPRRRTMETQETVQRRGETPSQSNLGLRLIIILFVFLRDAGTYTIRYAFCEINFIEKVKKFLGILSLQ